jgi:cellulose synthase/poly-beta-1,6-N-acetylglucosamine synthase-like glycosyltransferase
MNKKQLDALKDAKKRVTEHEVNAMVFKDPGKLIVFIDPDGVVHVDFLKDATEQLFNEVKKKCQELFRKVKDSPTAEFAAGTSALHCYI